MKQDPGSPTLVPQPETTRPAPSRYAGDRIEIRGARQHNLKGVDLDIPKHKLIVMTGVSGSGKSSLAFDTLFAEGQRRYVESLSAYARQFLGQMDKPVYDHIRGLSPTIAIDQKSAGSNPRSTVGTITEIHDHLRVLYARAGRQHCHICGDPVGAQDPAQIVADVLELPTGSRALVLAPIEARNASMVVPMLQPSTRPAAISKPMTPSTARVMTIAVDALDEWTRMVSTVPVTAAIRMDRSPRSETLARKRTMSADGLGMACARNSRPRKRSPKPIAVSP